MDNNIYKPYLMRIAAITDEAPSVRTFKLEFTNPEEAAAFTFTTGQFGLYSAFGEGESTFCIASSPTRSKGYIECTFRETGRVTSSLADKDVGDIVGFRGPYGNVFPPRKVERQEPGLRRRRHRPAPSAQRDLELPRPARLVQDITVVYGARAVNDLVYKNELEDWGKRSDIKLVVTVDPGGEKPGWTGKVGFVPPIVEQIAPPATNSVAIVCGPPIMIKLTLPVLAKLGFGKNEIYTTLENRMKCGLGNVGDATRARATCAKTGRCIRWRSWRSSRRSIRRQHLLRGQFVG